MVMALDGIKVVDLSRLAPGPYCSMLLADFGAEVTLVEAIPGASAKIDSRRSDAEPVREAAYNALGRGKRSIALNLKDPQALDVFLRLADGADVVLEGFRPGVVRRLGVDYQTLAARNPRLIYCSLSGYGQTGPLRNQVGHDINYIALAGALGTIGRPGEPPAIPVNYLADFAGGGLMAAFSICLALIARERTGRGQEVDIAMSDGALSLMTAAYSAFFSSGEAIRPGAMRLNGGNPFYDAYECADGRWFAIGNNEPHFFERFNDMLGLSDLNAHQFDTGRYPEMRRRYADALRKKTADEWTAVFAGDEVCATPVLSMDEAVRWEHNRARGMVVEVETPVGPVPQIGVAPKLSGTPGRPGSGAPHPGRDTDAVLVELGFDAAQVASMRAAGAVG